MKPKVLIVDDEKMIHGSFLLALRGSELEEQFDFEFTFSCDEAIEIRPNTVSIKDLENSLTNTLVQFSNVEIFEEELGRTFAVEREETERTLRDCSDNEIVLLNSGFADFQADELPEGNGTITGVLLREKDNFQLLFSIQELFL